jgi:hypothetical protein
MLATQVFQGSGPEDLAVVLRVEVGLEEQSETQAPELEVSTFSTEKPWANGLREAVLRAEQMVRSMRQSSWNVRYCCRCCFGGFGKWC